MPLFAKKEYGQVYRATVTAVNGESVSLCSLDEPYSLGLYETLIDFELPMGGYPDRDRSWTTPLTWRTISISHNTEREPIIIAKGVERYQKEAMKEFLDKSSRMRRTPNLSLGTFEVMRDECGRITIVSEDTIPSRLRQWVNPPLYPWALFRILKKVSATTLEMRHLSSWVAP